MYIYKLLLFIRKNEKLMYVLSEIYNILGFNCIKGKHHLKIMMHGVFCRNSKIVNKGINNILEIEKGCRLYNCKLQIFGDNNTIHIGHDCECKDVDIWISDGGTILIGNNTHFTGNIHIACIEGKKVNIGERCLFSSQIVFRTGDSHSILNKEGKRINPAADIRIGDHVWIGEQVIILKGAEIGAESIIGARTLVTGKKFNENVILAGSPAKEIKNGVSWYHELL